MTVIARIAITACLLLPVALSGQSDWPTYGHDEGGRRYSPLNEITPADVAKLTPAWACETGENASSLLTRVNANTGDIAWLVPLGSYKELEARGIRNTGTPNLGGPIMTASGVTFIGGTNDRRFRAFDSRTGKELWTYDLDAHAMAVPITFQGRNGKQYVVVATGGVGLLSAVDPRDGSLFQGKSVAFALP